MKVYIYDPFLNIDNIYIGTNGLGNGQAGEVVKN